jgi:intracellular septation protein A
VAEVLCKSGAGFGTGGLNAAGTIHPIHLPIMIREVQLNISLWVRQSHRWLSILFTLTVIANFVTRAFGEPLLWVTYSPLLPLFLLLFSGLYMFVLPYTAGRRAGAQERMQ